MIDFIVFVEKIVISYEFKVVKTVFYAAKLTIYNG